MILAKVSSVDRVLEKSYTLREELYGILPGQRIPVYRLVCRSLDVIQLGQCCSKSIPDFVHLRAMRVKVIVKVGYSIGGVP